LDAEKLFAKGPGGIGSDLYAFRPPFLTISLNSLVGGVRMARKEVCSDRKQRNQKSEVRIWKPARLAASSPKKEKEESLPSTMSSILQKPDFSSALCQSRWSVRS